MKILVVDDETLSTSRLTRLLQEQGYTDITSFNNPNEALINVQTVKYDVIFLDIQMPTINGLELANQILALEPKTFIIFQTAFEEFAIEAFKVGGLDYILKPSTHENIQNALSKVKKYRDTNPKKSTKKIMGKKGNKIYLIELHDIFYIKADLDEVIVKIENADVYVKKKIGEMHTLLQNENFFRIHRSIIVNTDKIKSMQTIEQSKLEISFHGIEEIVTSSKDGAKDFREYLERRCL
jgi:two-component system LytT family response regulator